MGRDWLQRHDPGYGALRRAGRAAILMPAMFAFTDKVIANPVMSYFVAFGSFAMLLLVDFAGSIARPAPRAGGARASRARR